METKTKEKSLKHGHDYDPIKANKFLRVVIIVAILMFLLSIFRLGELCMERKYQRNYISMETYLSVEDEVSLLNDQIDDLKRELDEQEALHNTEIQTYEDEIDRILSELESYRIADATLPDMVKYQSLPPNEDPSMYRTVVLKTVEERSPMSNLTSTEMNDLVNLICEKRSDDDEDPSDNPFYNSGDTFYEMECETGINAVYVMAIFTVESGFGESMCRPNNAGGITTGDGGYKSFNSIDDCILYTGSLLSRYRDNYGLESIYEIASRYCPVNPEWPDDVSDFVDTYSDYV